MKFYKIPLNVLIKIKTSCVLILSFLHCCLAKKRLQFRDLIKECHKEMIKFIVKIKLISRENKVLFKILLLKTVMIIPAY